MKLLEPVLFILLLTLVFGLIDIPNLQSDLAKAVVMSSITTLICFQLPRIRKWLLPAIILTGINILSSAITLAGNEFPTALWFRLLVGIPTLGLFIFAVIAQLQNTLRKSQTVTA